MFPGTLRVTLRSGRSDFDPSDPIWVTRFVVVLQNAMFMLNAVLFLLTAAVLLAPAVPAKRPQGLTLAELHKVLSNPGLKAAYFQCRRSGRRCSISDIQVSDAEEVSLSELRSDLDAGENKSWFLTFRKPTLAALLGFHDAKKNATDEDFETIIVRA